jgi:hypothetical protein
MTAPPGRMHPPDLAHDITSSGASGPPDWNSTDSAPVVSGWKAVDAESGPADRSGHATGDFENGPGRWQQT